MLLRLIVVCFAIVCLTATLSAQSDANKGSITGTVIDPNQAVIPNAKVLVTNTGTGLKREAATNDAGQFRFGSLDPGIYDVRAEAAGFAPTVVAGVVVTVGSAISVNLNAALQATTQTIEVTGGLVAVTESTSSQTLNMQAIQDLPINGRRFQDFATLTPTVQALSETRGQLSFVGQRGINSNVMVDGTDYNEPFFGGIRGGERSIFAFTLPQSAVQEFQAVTAGYAAEYGRSTGGVLNAITRSGANTFHGDGFYQLRHKELGLSNPLKQQSLETQHQFGGGVGGPIQRDKLFFFGAAEQQFARFPRLVRFATLDSVASNVTADIAPAYQFFRSQEGPFEQTNDVTAALGRADYQFTSGSRLGIRYSYSQNNARNAVSTGTSLNPQTNSALTNNGDEKDNTHTVVGQLTSVISATLLNDFRVQVSREERPRTANAQAPTLSAGIIGTIGTRSFLPTTASDRRFQFADAFSVQRSRHAFKFGADYNYVDFFQTFGFNQFGAFTVAGSNVRTILQILSRSGGASGNRLDDASVTFARQIGNLTLGENAHQIAFFAQDSWRATNTFTLNFGIRWEGQKNPQPAANNDFLVQNVRDFTFPLGRVDPTVIRNQMQQWVPRLGIAWNPGGGKTVMRAQTGLFYAQSPMILFAGPLNNFRIPAGDLSLNINPSGANTIYRQLLAAGIDLNSASLDKLPVLTIEQVTQIAGPGRNPFSNAAVITTSADSYRNPRAFQATASVEREVFGGLVLDYQMNRVNTIHLQRNIDYNMPRPFIRAGDLSQRPFFGLRSGTPRPNRNITTVLVRETGAHSSFWSNTFRAQYKKQQWQFALSYTLSYNKSDDDNERQAGGTFYQNPFDLRREYNWSSFDSRHQFGGYVVRHLPLGIEVAGLFRYRSGLPFDPTTGSDSGATGGSEILSGQSGSTVGNRPLEAPGVVFLRNSFRNRDLKTVDLRFLKNFSIKEGVKVQFSCEMFNLFNFENMRFEQAGFTYGPGLLMNGQPAPVDSRFMRLRTPTGDYDASTTSQQGTPFQAQLGIRIIF